jgi:hypothetical protein
MEKSFELDPSKYGHALSYGHYCKISARINAKDRNGFLLNKLFQQPNVTYSQRNFPNQTVSLAKGRFRVHFRQMRIKKSKKCGRSLNKKIK